MPLKWTSNQTQAKNTPFKGHPWSFLTYCVCSESRLEKILRLESALEDWWSCLMACDRPSHTLQHLLTRIQRFLNFFLEILEIFQILKSTHSVCFQLLLGSFKTFSLKIRENIYLQCMQMFFLPGSASLWQCFFLKVEQFHFVCKIFRECVQHLMEL